MSPDDCFSHDTGSIGQEPENSQECQDGSSQLDSRTGKLNALNPTKLLNERRLRRKIRRSERLGERELLLVPLLVDGGTAFDVGANKGIYALQMSKTAAGVLAFEPNPVFDNHLRHLPSNCRHVCRAPSSRRGSATLRIPPTATGRPAPNTATLEHVADEVGAIEDETAILDDFTDEPDIQLIKIDVEGHEPDVIAGGQRLIAQHRPALVVEALDTTAFESISAALANLDYRAYYLTGPGMVLKTVTADVERRLVDRNIVFLPAQSPVPESLSRRS